MIIETKYNVGEKVWVIDDTQKAVNVQIQHIDVEFHSATPFDDDVLSITYEFGFGKRREEFVFPQKKNYLKACRYDNKRRLQNVVQLLFTS